MKRALYIPSPAGGVKQSRHPMAPLRINRIAWGCHPDAQSLGSLLAVSWQSRGILRASDRQDDLSDMLTFFHNALAFGRFG